MTLTPEVEAAGRKLVVQYHKGAEFPDVHPIAEVVDEPERQNFLFLMLEMTVAATEVLHGRTNRDQSISGFMRHGYSREKAETYFDLAYDTLNQHTRKSASSDGALAARNNPLLASKVAALANRQGRTINRIGFTTRVLSVLLPLVLFLILLQHSSWWIALGFAVLIGMAVYLLGALISAPVTTRFANEFLDRWPRTGSEHGLAVAILDCLDGVPMKDELVGKIRKSEIDRINKALKERRRRT